MWVFDIYLNEHIFVNIIKIVVLMHNDKKRIFFLKDVITFFKDIFENKMAVVTKFSIYSILNSENICFLKFSFVVLRIRIINSLALRLIRNKEL